MGHIEDYYDKLYSVEADDGVRHWSPKLRVVQQRNSGKGSRWLREDGQDWSSPLVKVHQKVDITSGGIGNSNAKTLNSHSIAPKTVTLADLLKNPNLIRQTASNKHTHSSLHASTFMEEENAAVVSTNLKRSRNDLNGNNHLADSSQVPPMKSVITPSPSSKESSNSSSSSPMETSQRDASKNVRSSNNHFLSAEPVEQACRKS